MEKNNIEYLETLVAEMEYFGSIYTIVDNVLVTIDDVRRMIIADIHEEEAENETAIMYEQMEMDLKGIRYRG